MEEVNRTLHGAETRHMSHTETCSSLKRYISMQILGDAGGTIEDTTPLLEWGIVNSLEIIKLRSFIHDRFDVEVPYDYVTAEHFRNVGALARLIERLNAA